MEVIKNNENTDELCDLSDDHWKSRTIWVLIFSFFNAYVGHRIGEGWNVLKYSLASSHFYIDFFWTFIFLSLMVYWTVQVTAYFDKKQSWKNEFLLRLLVQILFAFLPSILFLQVMDHLYLQMTERSLFRITQNIMQFPFFLWLSLIYTLFYSLISLYTEYMLTIKSSLKFQVEKDLSDRVVFQENESKNLTHDIYDENPVITIHEGKDIRLLDLDIVLICNNNGMNTIYERNPNTTPILDSHTLKYLIERLDVNEYYQISRWELVARSIVKGYELRADKNFKLDLDYPLEQQLIINKDKIDDFAKWFLSK